jgi:hypothetical protein
MTVAAEKAICAWVNGNEALTGTPDAPGPLAMGAFTIEQRSPAGSGAYALIIRQQSPEQALIAEGNGIDRALILAQIRGGTRAVAEAAAAAYATAVLGLGGERAVMGDVTCLIADNVTGPQDVPPPPDQGELFLFQVSADFYLIGSN